MAKKVITTKDGKKHTVIVGSNADRKYTAMNEGKTSYQREQDGKITDKSLDGKKDTSGKKDTTSSPITLGGLSFSSQKEKDDFISRNKDNPYIQRDIANDRSTTTTPPAAAKTPADIYSGTSIVDYLGSTGQASDFATRAQLAKNLGIANYTGTAAQNTQLLNSLRTGASSTPAPTTPAVTPPTEKTDAELNYDAYIQKPDKTITDQEEIIRQLKEEAARPETDQEARDRITALFQREIDALNAAYAQQKIDATKAGLAQLGTNRAQQARFGLLGSTFGAAETAGIQQQTEEEKKKIDVANQAALAPVYNKITEELLQSRKDKEKARLSSAEDYLAQLKNAKEEKQKIAENAIRNLLVASATPTDKDLEKMAKQIGVDPSVFKGDYKTAVAEDAAAIAKSERDLVKTINTDNGTFISRDGGITWTPLAGSAKPTRAESSKPLNILDVQRYQELYPDAGVIAGDTEETANQKVSLSNSPETKVRDLILGAKNNGDSYETVLNDINTTGLFADKQLARKILDEIYKQGTNPLNKFSGQTIGTANPNNRIEDESRVVDSIRNILFR